MSKWMKTVAPVLVAALGSAAFAAPNGPGVNLPRGAADARGSVMAAQGRPKTRVIVYNNLLYGYLNDTDTTQFTYDRHGNCIREDSTWDGAGDGTIDSTHTVVREFDAGNRVVREETVYANAAGVPWATFLETWTYDSRGRLLERTWEYDDAADGVVDQWETEVRTWDAQGRALTRDRSYGISYAAWGLQGGYLETESSRTTEWEQHGHATQWTTDWTTEDSMPDYGYYALSFRTTETSAAYDGRGNLLSDVTLVDFGSDGTWDRREAGTLTRSSRGDVLSEVRTGDDGIDGTLDSVNTMDRSYDRRGNPTGFRFADDWDNDGAPEFLYVEVTELDRFGNPVRRSYDADISGVPYSRDTVTYTY